MESTSSSNSSTPVASTSNESTPVSATTYYRTIRGVGAIIEKGVSNGFGINDIVKMISGRSRRKRKIVKYRAETTLYLVTKRLEEAMEDRMFCEDKYYTYNGKTDEWTSVN